MKRMNFWMGLALFLFTFACTKSDPTSSEAPRALVTTHGVPDGAAVTKIIGAAGGSITSTDGNFSITIPAGALAGDQEISVQPVMNQLPAGYDRAYRLNPHDIQFQQPVTIRFRYNENSIRNTVPELLGIAYQDQEGKWFHAEAPTLDQESHTLSVSTTHFSDWGYFPYFYIDPSEALVDPGARLDLHVMATVPSNPDYVPLPGDSPVLQPYQPDNSYLGAWSYSGDGLLKGNGNKAHYQAPNSAPRANPEAVSVVVKMQRKGQFLLVSNITIRTEFHIDYMQVDETEVHSGGLNYPSRLWI